MWKVIRVPFPLLHKHVVSRGSLRTCANSRYQALFLSAHQEPGYEASVLINLYVPLGPENMTYIWHNYQASVWFYHKLPSLGMHNKLILGIIFQDKYVLWWLFCSPFFQYLAARCIVGSWVFACQLLEEFDYLRNYSLPHCNAGYHRCLSWLLGNYELLLLVIVLSGNPLASWIWQGAC